MDFRGPRHAGPPIGTCGAVEPVVADGRRPHRNGPGRSGPSAPRSSPQWRSFAAWNILRTREATVDELGAGERVSAVLRAGRSLAQVMRPVVWCRQEDPIREVARLIGESGASCALVRQDGGIGIVTDHDFRARVATGQVSADAPVAQVATSPVLTIASADTVADALLRMLDHGVHHLVVTDPTGIPVGVVRVVDIASAEVSDPIRLRSTIG